MKRRQIRPTTWPLSEFLTGSSQVKSRSHSSCSLEHAFLFQLAILCCLGADSLSISQPVFAISMLTHAITWPLTPHNNYISTARRSVQLARRSTSLPHFRESPATMVNLWHVLRTVGMRNERIGMGHVQIIQICWHSKSNPQYYAVNHFELDVTCTRKFETCHSPRIIPWGGGGQHAPQMYCVLSGKPNQHTHSCM